MRLLAVRGSEASFTRLLAPVSLACITRPYHSPASLARLCQPPRPTADTASSSTTTLTRLVRCSASSAHTPAPNTLYVSFLPSRAAF